MLKIQTSNVILYFQVKSNFYIKSVGAFVKKLAG